MGKTRRKEKDVTANSCQETKRYIQSEMLESTTPEYKLRELVPLPEYVSYEEWLASHCLALFDHINLIYGTISEFCSTATCPDMIGPNNRLYLWVDEKGKRLKLPAPQYIDYVMTYTQRSINDKSIFPTKFDKEFPQSFQSIVKKILMLLFHVLAHVYHSHFKEIEILNLYSQVNCVFSHLILFNEQFSLIDEKETEVLDDLAIALKLFPEVKSNNLITGDQSTNPQSSSSQQGQTLNASCSNDIDMDDIKVDIDVDNVITTQCRSISPFVTDSDYGKLSSSVPESDQMDATETGDAGRISECDNRADKSPSNDDNDRMNFECETAASVLSQVPLSNLVDCKIGEQFSSDSGSSGKLVNQRCSSESAIQSTGGDYPVTTSGDTGNSDTKTMSISATRRSNSSGAPEDHFPPYHFVTNPDSLFGIGIDAFFTPPVPAPPSASSNSTASFTLPQKF